MGQIFDLPTLINKSFPDFSVVDNNIEIKNKNQNELTLLSIKSKKIAQLVMINNLMSDNLSKRLDAILLNRFSGTIIFLLIFLLIFQSIFTYVSPLVDLIDSSIVASANQVKKLMPHSLLSDFIADGVITGVGSVLVFLPQIILLFFFIGIMEYSGFMTRASLIVDRFMQYVGLQGKSFLPLLSSYACAVPGIMATRTLESKKQKIITVFISPFMTCSARLPVYILLVSAFIPSKSYFYGLLSLPMLTFIGLYALGLLAAIITSYGLKFILKSEETMDLYIQELPSYRIPSLKLLFNFILIQVKSFIKKAGTIILMTSVILWLLLNSPYKSVQNGGISESYAAKIGQFFEPATEYLGFDWKINVGLIGSFAAREVVVSTLALIYQIDEENEETLKTTIQNHLTFPSAMSLIVFFVFALQCISTLAIAKRELNSWGLVSLMFFYMQILALFSSFLTYRICLLI